MDKVVRAISVAFKQLITLSMLLTKQIYKLDLTVISFEKHLIISCLARLGLIIYGIVQDNTSEVLYTDIDYKVVTDGARHILNGESPFRRHTYRYSPLLAYLVLPNLLVHETFGKVLFTSCDVLASVLIRKIVHDELNVTLVETSKTTGRRFNEKFSSKAKLTTPDRNRKTAELSSYLWLYNPVGMVISTRGNSDAISNLLILITIFYILKQKFHVANCFVAGIAHGLAIHFRLFPIIFSLALFLNVADKNWKSKKDLLRALLLPNRKQLALTFGTILSLSTLTYLFYLSYGYEYIYEAYLYHFSRVDIRHNYSLYFLMRYLNSDVIPTLFEKIFVLLPQFIVLFYLSITFGLYRKTLPFCIFAQTFIFVTYNSVVTAQYFAWYLALLPLCAPNFRNITAKFGLTLFFLWLLAQGLWLCQAFLLEFKCWNTFNLIGIQGIGFFLINIFIMQRCILNVSDFFV